MDATCRPRRGYGSIPYVMVGLIQTAIMSYTTKGTQARRSYKLAEMITTISCSKTYTRTHVVYCD